jgi:hypothetical protein
MSKEASVSRREFFKSGAVGGPGCRKDVLEQD